MKFNTLSKALLAGLVGTAGMVGISNAVNVNPDGIGQALIYPYYTTRDGQVSLMSVVNTSDVVKAVKVRFIEAKASAEVLDFNLYLSPYDVWTAAIVDTGDGAGVATSDNSCTAPTVAGVIPFRNSQYAGDAAEDASLDRTREGYVELIEMAVVTGTHAAWATHSGAVGGSPSNCAAIVNSWSSATGTWRLDPFADTEVVEDGGSLFGGLSVIDPAVGSDASYNAYAFEAFNNTTNLHTDPGDLFPSLASADPDSVVFWNGGAVASAWGADANGNGQTGADAVSATITHDQIMNEWSTEAAGGIVTSTDWVVTFPTKRFYVPSDGSLSDVPFSTALTPSGACEGIDLHLFDREEATPSFGSLDFSPPDFDNPGANLCWEVSTITFNDSNALSSALAENIDTATGLPGAPNGWLTIDFDFVNNFTGVTEHPLLSSDDGDDYVGLPSVGFMVQEFVDTDPATSANYTGLFPHRGTRAIQ
ncbi:MAG: hypothetical protein ACWA5R_14530 [bacterium]